MYIYIYISLYLSICIYLSIQSIHIYDIYIHIYTDVYRTDLAARRPCRNDVKRGEMGVSVRLYVDHMYMYMYICIYMCVYIDIDIIYI